MVRPRSFCPGCEKMIVWYDNVPLLRLRPAPRAAAVTAASSFPGAILLWSSSTAIAFGLCFRRVRSHGTSGEIRFALSAILIALTASDLESRILPDEFTLGGTLAGLVFALFVPMDEYIVTFLIPMKYAPRWHWLGESAFAALVGSGAIWLVAILYEKFRHKEGMGLGDVKMIAMIGAFLGLRWSLLTLMLASLAGSIVGLIYLKATRKDAATYELPFGSFLGLSALAIVMWTQIIPALQGVQDPLNIQSRTVIAVAHTQCGARTLRAASTAPSTKPSRDSHGAGPKSYRAATVMERGPKSYRAATVMQRGPINPTEPRH